MIVQKKLDRVQNKKVYFGRFEVALLLKEALQTSSTSSSGLRQSKIQNGCQILASFFTSARPSTMGPGDPKLAQEGKVESLFLVHLRNNPFASVPIGILYPLHQP